MQNIEIQILRVVTPGINKGTNTAYIYNKKNNSTNNVHYSLLLLSRSISSENTDYATSWKLVTQMFVYGVVILNFVTMVY